MHPQSTQICVVCGTSFTPPPWKQRRPQAKSPYCGHACYRLRGRQRPLAERFWEKVNKNGPVPAHCPELGPCWVWTGAPYPSGYGQINVDGKIRRAHRVVWELTYGPLAPNKSGCHKCDNPPCVRPTHLFEGTKKENSQDCARKGRAYRPMTGPTVTPERRARGERNGRATHPERTARGEENGGARLTAAQVREIRGLYVPVRGMQAKLGRQYGVSPATIALIVQGKKWRQIDQSTTISFPSVTKSGTPAVTESTTG